jgi:Helix-turn-helix domain
MSIVPGSDNGQGNSVTANLLTALEVARILNVSPGWVRDHATRKQPRIPMLKVGKLQRFRPADISQFLEDLRKPPTC